MDLRRIAEHTVDLDLLPAVPLVLDAGCRGFEFSREILDLRPAGRVIALDPDPGMEPPADSRITFLPIALISSPLPKVRYFDRGGGGAGNFIEGVRFEDQPTGARAWMEVPTATIIKLQACAASLYGCGRRFDLIKLDIEGAEFDVLEHWPGPVATQLSIEFHDAFDKRFYDNAYFERLFAGPLWDYHVAQHPYMKEPYPDWGHWDSLLILRDK